MLGLVDGALTCFEWGFLAASGELEWSSWVQSASSGSVDGLDSVGVGNGDFLFFFI